VESDILFDVGEIFIEVGYDSAFEFSSLEPFAEIDEIVHDILTININTSWVKVLLNQNIIIIRIKQLLCLLSK